MPIKQVSQEDIPYWLKCLIVLIGVILLVFLVPALLTGILYLSSDILTAYFRGTDSKEIRSSILLLSAALGAIGIPLFIWRTLIAAQQSNIARDRSYTEMFTKVVEQLGAEKPAIEILTDKNNDPITDEAGRPLTQDTYVPNIEVRIGAIFALERIMKDSEKDAPAIVDTLAAYVRENCGKASLECEIPEKDGGQSNDDWVQAIRNYVGHIWAPDSLVARARAMQERPEVNRADIKTALTVLGKRPLHLKDPKYFRTKETKPPDLRAINFQGWDLEDFDLAHCNLSNAQMQGANLKGAKMQGANLSGAEMQDTDLSGAQMQGTNLSGADMQGAKLFLAKTQGSDVFYAKMQDADLSYAQMQGADMEDTDLSGAQMQEVQIASARKTAASVIWVDFTKTNFDFDELQSQLPEMFGHQDNKITILPDKMTRPDFWSKEDLSTLEGREQYEREWEAFKNKMDVE